MGDGKPIGLSRGSTRRAQVPGAVSSGVPVGFHAVPRKSLHCSIVVEESKATPLQWVQFEGRGLTHSDNNDVDTPA